LDGGQFTFSGVNGTTLQAADILIKAQYLPTASPASGSLFGVQYRVTGHFYIPPLAWSVYCPEMKQKLYICQEFLNIF